MEMGQYLPPPSPLHAPTEKPQSKLPARVDGIVEESKRKPPSRSTSKTVLPKVDLPVDETVEEEFQPIEPTARPPPRTRKASTQSTSTAPPVSRSVSATAKARPKTKRDPSPELLDADVHMPPEYEQSEPVALPRQGSKPVSRAAGHSSSQVVGADVQDSTSRKPGSSTRPLSTSQAQSRAPKTQKDTLQLDDRQDGGSSEELGGGLPVVDISTDDDDEPKVAKTPAKAKGKGKTQAKGKKLAVQVQETRLSRPSQTVRQPATSQGMDGVDDDVEMAEVEESIQPEPDPLPTTPRKPSAIDSTTVTDAAPQWSHGQTSPEGFFTPPLAIDPFVNMSSLSEAEQDMTVEEWIRYQMGIEYERFKRDGERQLGLFELRAEEVRRAIETL
ncbi:hypothetical protein B0H12DRAFT_1091538 [Mycena haematopus]|nr:hypothetical protein B0H12DRAFT_1091538 [Mycena haematopus]